MPELIVGILAVLAWASIELYYIVKGQQTISEHVRDLFIKYPPMGMLAGLLTGMLLGHFFWFR